ncbi:3-hydroxyacyl-CoA dehydrogenase family protein [Natribaculum luteum]|uniref:3-hydroxyacyl-CoA dehydrogenase family protein n=1 Tax=Natribaculum luteum TaxID=1586232 RepID=A0ABD5P1A7_9EURY|nr:3-hydroxyacyl-CoA dehydrogenase NAD-binding domain-containing protein [Natribaculum luteum]
MSASAIDRVAIVGTGMMGYGIGTVYSSQGCTVRMYDVSEEALAQAETNVEATLTTLANAGRIPTEDIDAIADRITYHDALDAAVEDADLVTEAVTEDLEIKQEVFERLDRHAPASATLATNTSGLSITEIASVVDDPSRVVGTHWFNPPHIVPLVEVVRGDQTADATVDRMYDLLEAAGKEPVEVKKDIPGFIGNRIQMAMDFEAWSLLQMGVASAEDIDRAVRAGFGFRVPVLGVFKKSDFTGLDIYEEVMSYLLQEIDRGTEPSESLRTLVDEGHYGVKTGQGVYDWEGADFENLADERDRQLLALLDAYEEAID